MKQTPETTVGIFLLSGLALICGLIIFYGQMGDFLTPTYHFTVDFPDASELIKGSDVFLSGAKIGKVLTNPEPVLGKHHVQVEIQIRKDIPLRKNLFDENHKLITKGDSFVVTSSGLLGDRFVNVEPVEYPEDTPEQNKAPLIQDGDHIVGTPTTDMSSIIEGAKPLEDNANEVMAEINHTLKKLNGEILTDSTTTDIKETLASLKDTVSHANLAIQHADTMIQDSDAVIKKAGVYLDEAKNGHGLLNELMYDPKVARNVSDLIQNLKEHGPVFYTDTSSDSSNSDNENKGEKGNRK